MTTANAYRRSSLNLDSSSHHLNLHSFPTRRSSDLTQEKLLAEAAQQGRFTLEAANRANPEDEAGTTALRTLVTVSDMQTYAQACHQAAEDIFRAMSEEEVARPVESPFGTYPAWAYFNFA